MKHTRVNIVLVLTLAVILSASTALANPSGASVVYNNAASGNVTVTQPNGNTIQVNIPGTKAIINWNSFSIGSGETTSFVFANGASGLQNAVLNRVTGASSSTIAGQLQANGAVFLVNPNGVVFSSTGRVNTPAFFATTLNISDAQFKAFSPTQTSTDHWQMDFTAGGAAGTIELQTGAQILAQGQSAIIALMAKSVSVAPGVTLSAPNGTVMLIAAKQATLSQSGSGDYGMFNIAYNTGNGNNVANSGTVSILDGSNQGGGSVAMVGNNVTQSGTISAATASQKVSRILLVASGDVNVAAGSVTDASGGGTNRAGYIGVIAGGTATIANGATITAQGSANDGGDIIIKGNGLAVGQGAVIDVTAPGHNAGQVTRTLNGGGDLYATVEYARTAVRPNGDKMVLINDGTLNLPPVLPPQTKREAENILSKTVNLPITGQITNKPGISPNDSKPATVVPVVQEKPAAAPPDAKPGNTANSPTPNKETNNKNEGSSN